MERKWTTSSAFVCRHFPCTLPSCRHCQFVEEGPVMDGYEAIRRIRNLTAGGAAKIIAITASAFTAQRQDILAAGCDEVIHKPFRAQEIFESMARLLDIKFRYEKGGQAAIRKVGSHLAAEMLADLPGESLRVSNSQPLLTMQISGDKLALPADPQ